MPVKKKYYVPTEMGREKKIKEFMELLKQSAKSRGEESSKKP